MSAQRELIPDEIPVKLFDRWAHLLISRAKTICENDVLTREEAAEYIRYTPNHLDKMVAAGKVKAHRIYAGADPRFLRSELLEAIRKG